MILTYAILASELLLSLAVLLGLYRLVRGPTVADRVIAFDLMVLAVVAFTALLSVEEGTAHFVELILIVSLLGFFGTVALVKTFDAADDVVHDSALGGSCGAADDPAPVTGGDTRTGASATTAGATPEDTGREVRER